MGPEGLEPPPTGLKGRHAAATPRPRAGTFVPGYSFRPDHRFSPLVTTFFRPFRFKRGAASSADRANFQEWAGGRSNPRLLGFNQPLDRLSYRPVLPFQRKGPVYLGHTGPETPREGCSWPGVTSARDNAGAGMPTDRRIAPLLGNPGCDANCRRTWTTSVQLMYQVDSLRGRFQVSTRRLALLLTRHAGEMFAHSREIFFPRSVIENEASP
jgi:hypothetical protein